LKIESLDKLIQSASNYLEARIELIKIELREEFASFLVKAVLVLMVMLLTTFMILFMGFGAALWINDWLDSSYAGFLIVGGVILIKIIFIFLLKFTRSGNRFLQKIVGFLVEE